MDACNGGLGLLLDLVFVVTVLHGPQLVQGGFDACLVAVGDLVAVFLQVALGRVDRPLRPGSWSRPARAALCPSRMRLGFLDHLFDVGVGQAARGLDADLLFLAGRLVLGRHVDDAVGVDVERDLDLRHAARRRRNPTRSN